MTGQVKPLELKNNITVPHPYGYLFLDRLLQTPAHVSQPPVGSHK